MMYTNYGLEGTRRVKSAREMSSLAGEAGPGMIARLFTGVGGDVPHPQGSSDGHSSQDNCPRPLEVSCGSFRATDIFVGEGRGWMRGKALKTEMPDGL